MSVIEKQMVIAAREESVGWLESLEVTLRVELTLDCAPQADLPLGLMQQHHEFGGREQLALTHSREVRRNFTERFWGSRNDRAEHGAHEILGLRLAIEYGYNAGEVTEDIGLRRNRSMTRTDMRSHGLRTLSISAMMGMRNRASRSRSLTRLFTSATS